MPPGPALDTFRGLDESTTAGMDEMAEEAPTARTRLRRAPERGRYDRAAIDAILDAGVLCHVGYVIDDQPLVTPTLYWREGDRVYWHGSSASNMLRGGGRRPRVPDGQPL